MANHTTGFGTTVKIVTTAPAVTLELEETEVTPPAIIGNEKIEQTSNRNTAYKSFVAGDLKEVGDVAFTAYYSTDDWDDIDSIINVKATVTITFKNGATIVDTDGWLVSATPTGQLINERPTMDCVISFGGEDSAGTPSQTVTPSA